MKLLFSIPSFRWNEDLNDVRMNEITSYAATAAYWSGILAIVSMVALFIMFGGLAVFGPINDATSSIQFLLLIPVAIAWQNLLGSRFGILSQVIMVIGILAMLVFGVSQILLVLKVVTFEQTLNLVLSMGCVISFWMLANSLMGFRVASLPLRVNWIGAITGLSMIMVAVGYWWLGGPKHPLTAIFFLVGAIGMPLWAFGMAKVL